MQQELTQYQAAFATRFKERVTSGELVVDAFNKIGEEDTGTYSIFKMWLFEYCMDRNIYFHEGRHFIIVGTTKEICEVFEAQITQKLSDHISRMLHKLKMIDTVKNVN